MAFQTAWTKVHELASAGLISGSLGCYQLTDDSQIAGLGTVAGDTATMHFMRSTDDGITWSEISTLPFSQNTRGNRLAKFPGNVLIYATEAPDFVDFHIHRSTNGGAAWNEVKTFTGDPSFIGATGLAFAAMSAFRETALLTGRVPNNAGAQVGSYARSDDQGLTWVLGPNLTAGGAKPLAWSAANASAGTWLLGQGKKQLFKTTDAGATWANLGPLPEPAPSSDVVFYATSWLTNTIAVVGGEGAGLGWVNQLALWQTTNGGAAWTRIPNANFAEYAGPGAPPVPYEAKRFTKAAIIIGIGVDTRRTQSPVRISFDQGLTYNHVGTGWSFATPGIILAGGNIVLTPNGTFLLTIDTRGAPGDKAQIWRGVVTC